MFTHALTPILNVSDIQASFAWFEKLGWRRSFEWGEPASFGGVVSGQVEIFLCENAQGGRGRFDITWPPTNMPWGVREMHLRHPDGHVFRISTRAAG